TRLLDTFLSAADITRRGLGKLGAAADTSIVTTRFARLGTCAAQTGAVFLPSGAGGGDVGVFLGRDQPSKHFAQMASRFGFRRVPLAIDPTGVRLVEPEPNGSES